MKHRKWTFIANAAVAASLACSSAEPLTPEFQADAGTPPGDGGPTSDGGLVMDDRVRISGQALRLGTYLSGNRVPVPSAQISALGVVGVNPVNSGLEGSYAIRVPQNGNLILSAQAPNFLGSHESVVVAGNDLNGKDFILASITYLNTIATPLNVAYRESFACHAPNVGQCKFAVVIGRVVDDGSADNGTPTPLGDIRVNEFTIRVDGDENWYTMGPYVLFPTGRADPAGTVIRRARSPSTNKYIGGLFVYFVEVPLVGPESREFEILVASAAGGAQNRYFRSKADLAFRDGFTWVTVPETGIAPPPPPPPPNDPPPVVSFTNQVYPLFLRVDQGGTGCVACHHDQGLEPPPGGLDLSGGAPAAFAALDPARYPNRVNVANPGASLVLTKPLYETDGPQNHPIFAFLSEQDPGYRALYDWIRGGAIDDTVNLPPPQISFYNDVRPLLYQPVGQGGAGCDSCHVQGVDPATAPGGAYFGGDGNALWQVLTQDPPSDNGNTGEPYRIHRAGLPERSLLLLNPTAGTIEPHPQKLFNGVNDVRYQTIYRWIIEGYVNDTP